MVIFRSNISKKKRWVLIWNYQGLIIWKKSQPNTQATFIFQHGPFKHRFSEVSVGKHGVYEPALYLKRTEILQLLLRGQACSLDSLSWKSLVTLQTFHKFAEWLQWSINTPPIAPGGENSHIRNSKKPKPQVHSEFCDNNTVDLVQWKIGWMPKTIIAAIVLVVTQSLKCNIQEGHFITSNRASIMCKICSLNGLAIISIITGYSGR